MILPSHSFRRSFLESAKTCNITHICVSVYGITEIYPKIGPAVNWFMRYQSAFHVFTALPRNRRLSVSNVTLTTEKRQVTITAGTTDKPHWTAAAAADAEWTPQENGKPISTETEYIGMRSLHWRGGPEKRKKMENSYNAVKKIENAQLNCTLAMPFWTNSEG